MRSLVIFLCAFITAIALGIAGSRLLGIPFLVSAALIALIILSGWLVRRIGKLNAAVETMRHHAIALGTFESTLTERLDMLDRAGQERDRQLANIQQRLGETRRDLGEMKDFQTMPPPVSTPESIALTQAQDTQQTQTSNASKPELKSAIRRDALSLHLQPIVALPSREPKHFQVSMRMQNEDGAWLEDATFAEIATAGRLWPQIDRKMLFAAVRIQRRLGTLKKRSSLLCPISEQTLANKRSFEPILQFVKANQSMAGSISFVLNHAALERLTPAAQERLGELVDAGFRLAFDNFADFDANPRALASQGARFLLSPIKTLARGRLIAEDNAADWSELGSSFANCGISLIVSELDDVETLPILFDCGVTMASGPLFADPRPIRDELKDDF